MNPCPPRDQLKRLLEEQLDEQERAALESHIEGCAPCQIILSELVTPSGAPGNGRTSGRPAFYQEGLSRDFLGRLKKERPNGPVPRDRPSSENASSTRLEGSVQRAGRPAPPLIPGYDIKTELGHGGMAVVYQARQLALGRVVALKLMRDGHSSLDARARFRREAEAVAQLQHPNIVQIHEIGEYQGCPFLALEFVSGGSLARRLQGKPLPGDDAAQIALALARAMAYAHDRGIVHRDLKPANILLAVGSGQWAVGSKAEEVRGQQSEVSEEAGSLLPTVHCPLPTVPKITDFGLAKRLDHASNQTQSGAILGTPSYMAPEQAEGKGRQAGPLADVYGLGAILYEMLTGRPPFRAETPLHTLQQVLHDEPVTPSRLQPKVPRDLQTICLKCLQKDPRNRYASAAALALDLERFLAGKSILARPASQAEHLWRWGRRNPVVAGLLATVALSLLTVAGVATFMAVRIAGARHAEALVAEENRKQLVRLLVDKGTALMQDGDVLGALPWLTEAFRLDVGNPERDQMHRWRLAAVLQQCPKLQQVWFHEARVNDAAFSPDGTHVVTASADKTARVWNTRTGEASTPPLRHDADVVQALFDNNGNRVLTASEDGTARLWDAATGRLLALLKHDGKVTSAVFSPDGRRVLTTSADHTARIWDPVAGKQVTRVKHGDKVTAACFSPDGGRIVTVAWDQTARVWAAATGQPLSPPLRHARLVLGARFTPDGTRVITFDQLGTAQVWPVGTEERIAATPLTFADTHPNWPTYRLFAETSPDGRRVVMATEAAARVWDLATGRAVTPPLPHAASVLWARFSLDGRRMVTASAYGTARVWDAVTGKALGPPLHHPGEILQVRASPDGRRVVTACRNGTACVWDLATGGPVPLHLPHRMEVGAVQFSRRGDRIGTGATDSTARVWSTVTGEPIGPPVRLTLELDFDPDLGRVLTGSRDGTASLWQVDSGKRVWTCELDGAAHVTFSPQGSRVVTAYEREPGVPAGPRGEVQVRHADTGELLLTLPLDVPPTQIRFSPDGRLLAASAGFRDRGEVHVWDAATGAPVTPPLRHEHVAQDVFFSPDGRWLASAGVDAARIWDVATGQLVAALTHASSINTVAFSPDSRLVATASRDNTARIWAAATGQPITGPLKHRAEVRYLAFSRDGRRLLTSSRRPDANVRMWDTATGDLLMPPLEHLGHVEMVACSPDGRSFATASGLRFFHGEARLYRVDASEMPAEDLARLARLLSGQQISTHPTVTPGAVGDGPVGEGSDSVPVAAAEVRALWQALRFRYPERFAASPEESREWERQQQEPLWLFQTDQGLAAIDLGEWEKAAASLSEAIEAPGAPVLLWRWLLLLRMHLGDREGSRHLCQRLLERFGDKQDLETIREVASTCVSLPSTLSDPGRALELAELATAREPGNRESLHTLAMALYRAGQYERALQQFTVYLKKDPSNRVGVEEEPASGQTRLYLAMVHQRLGHVDLARHWLARALDWLAQDNDQRFHVCLTNQILRREAEEMIPRPAASVRP
jgi:WD40 repeat protein/serine/threonine protein kinase